MDYTLSEQEKQMQKDLAAFCRAHIAPRARELDQSSREAVPVLMRENLRTLAKSSWLGVGHEGDSIDLIKVYLAGEELAKACPATFLSARASTFLCAGALRLFGTADQKQCHVPGLMQAETVGALAYTEEQAGSDLGALRAHAHREGDTWVLNGMKDVVVNAPMADVLLVLAYITPAAGPERGMGLFIVEKGAPGLSVGAPVETMGLRGVPIGPVEMNNCRASGVLGGEPGHGHEQIMHLLEFGTVGVAAMCVGIGSACMECSTRHAQSRMAFGRQIGKFQDVGFKLADMFTFNDLGRMLALRAALALNAGEQEAGVMAACAKLFTSEAVTRIAGWGMQILAGHGYLAGTDMERLYRDARFGEICEGTSEMQRALIARNELDRFLPV